MAEACVTCGRMMPLKARGLCARCYMRARASGQLFAFPLDPHRTGLHARTCPTCADGGLVTTYRVVDGQVTSYICLARAHRPARTVGRIFRPEDARKPPIEAISAL